MAKKKDLTPTEAAPVTSYKHVNDKRKRIPTQEESVKLSPRDKQPVKKKYTYDPSLDPQLVWSGKEEAGSELGVPTVPIYVQEKIAPEAIIARLKSGSNESTQMLLFGETAQEQFNKSIEFYKHEDNWQNRMILGDSLLAMNSLLEKEGLRSKIQMIYVDPPYGIKFGSNWQTSTRKRDVKDNKIEDFIRQPEQIKAFRDTWELGVHSYLSYLRDRLIVARELLGESGSCFVQISDENIHLVRNVLDEVFGSENFISIIAFKKKKMPLGETYIFTMCDYIVWYAKDFNKMKFRRLYIPREKGEDSDFNCIQLENGEVFTVSDYLRNNKEVPASARYFQSMDMRSSGRTESCVFEYEYEGRKFYPSGGKSWKTNLSGMQRLNELGRLFSPGDSLRYKYFLEDYPVMEMSHMWMDTQGATDMTYVVQTAEKVVQRCILMTTDPGDIVLDPTCGSGTTAYQSELLGRRWIATDTSRVALALARTRVMTAKYPFYKLKEQGNVRSGFEYMSVAHTTLGALANNEPTHREVLYDCPLEDKNIIRVAGPFTVESLSPHRVSDAQEMLSSDKFVETIVANLLKAGIQTGDRNARVEFSNLDILPGGPEIQASGEYKTKSGLKKAAIAIGPEFGSVDDDFIRDAARVAQKFSDLLIVAATSFDASAFTETSEVEGLRIMKVKINPDLSMGDLLKKTGAGNLFLAFGEPEVKVKETKGGLTVEVVGVDIYDPVKAEIRTSGSGDPEHDIAAWFIDTNYSGEAFFVTHAYFLGADKPYEKLKKALKADIREDVWDELYSTVSRPFPKPKTGKIAVKVINHYGDEVMKILEIK